MTNRNIHAEATRLLKLSSDRDKLLFDKWFEVDLANLMSVLQIADERISKSAAINYLTRISNHTKTVLSLCFYRGNNLKPEEGEEQLFFNLLRIAFMNEISTAELTKPRNDRQYPDFEELNVLINDYMKSFSDFHQIIGNEISKLLDKKLPAEHLPRKAPAKARISLFREIKDCYYQFNPTGSKSGLNKFTEICCAKIDEPMEIEAIAMAYKRLEKDS